MPYEILLQHASIVSCLCVFGISHFGLYYLYSSTKDIRKLRVEGQKPDGIIEHKHFGEIWYFWYFTDLQSGKSGQKLNYTLGAEEDE